MIISKSIHDILSLYTDKMLTYFIIWNINNSIYVQLLKMSNYFLLACKKNLKYIEEKNSNLLHLL